MKLLPIIFLLLSINTSAQDTDTLCGCVPCALRFSNRLPNNADSISTRPDLKPTIIRLKTTLDFQDPIIVGKYGTIEEKSAVTWAFEYRRMMYDSMIINACKKNR